MSVTSPGRGQGGESVEQGFIFSGGHLVLFVDTCGVGNGPEVGQSAESPLGNALPHHRLDKPEYEYCRPPPPKDRIFSD